jgi:hypothetical protein
MCERPQEQNSPPGFFCHEKARLLNEFLGAVHEYNHIQEQQTKAVIDGDEDFNRFDVLLHLAQEKKERAKYAWMTHIEHHGCHGGDSGDAMIDS